MRIVVATHEGAFSNQITQALLAGRPGEVVGVIRSRSILVGHTLPGSAWRIARRGGAAFAALKQLETWLLRGRAPALERLCSEAEVPLLDVHDVNAPATLAQLDRWQPDLAISVYLNHLIREPFLALPRHGVLNVHGALLPAHRGLFPAFWALLGGKPELGSTVHWVDERFDTGPVLLQRSIPIRAGATVIDLQQRAAEVGAGLLLESLGLVEAGTAPRIAQDESAATTHSWPTSRDVLRFYRGGGRYGLGAALR